MSEPNIFPETFAIALKGGVLKFNQEGIKFDATNPVQSWRLDIRTLNAFRDFLLRYPVVRPNITATEIKCRQEKGILCSTCSCQVCTPKACKRPGEDCPPCFRSDSSDK